MASVAVRVLFVMIVIIIPQTTPQNSARKNLNRQVVYVASEMGIGREDIGVDYIPKAQMAMEKKEFSWRQQQLLYNSVQEQLLGRATG